MMAPRLRPEIIAAIEIAVEMNDRELEPAFIRSLAKIYRTSPQAIVWNTKRYNKVKSGKDDRKKNGRKPAMEKEKTAEIARKILENEPSLKYDKISDALFKEFGIQVSTTWVSRLLNTYEIPIGRLTALELRRIPKKRKHRGEQLADEDETDKSLGQNEPQNFSQTSSATVSGTVPLI